MRLLQRRASRALIGILAGIGVLSIAPMAPAQFTANFQTNIISGVTSNWSGDYDIGNTNFADVLLIQSSGMLSNGFGFLGFNSNSSNNSVIVSGSGSMWTNANDLAVGASGDNNTLVINNSGVVFNANGTIGSNTTAVGNSVAVSDTGSVWLVGGGQLQTGLYVGWSGYANSLVISNGGSVFDVSSLLGSPPNWFVGYNASSSNNTVLVTDPGSVWGRPGGGPEIYFGLSGPSNTLAVRNGGKVRSTFCWIGYNASSANNQVLVTGPGSVWSNREVRYIGYAGMSNSLVISDGGQVFDANANVYSSLGCYVGYAQNTAYNIALVTGPGSLWKMDADLYVGYRASINSLLISNVAQVINRDAYIGNKLSFNQFTSNNVVRVADGGMWQNGALYVGHIAGSNSVMIAGGSVFATNLTVGFGASPCNNLVEMDSGTLTVTNAATNAVLEVSYGVLVLGGGVLQVDRFVITNGCAQFLHTGGTLLAGNFIIDPNAFRITSITHQGNDLNITWMMGPGQTNTLQATAGDGNGGYNTNGFTDIFVVTNNASAGTVTNYLDMGAATNVPTRYYRARLVP